jgi:glycine oxidase
MSRLRDILVIGGGIVGLTSAIRLREAGASVAVFDRSDFGREASWAGAGILPPGNPDRAATPIDRLRAFGAAEFPILSAQLRESTGIDNGYRVNGGIEYLSTEDDYAINIWSLEGIPFERLDDDRLPNATAYHLPDMAQVRNPRHLKALIAQARNLDIELFPHSGVEAWHRSAGRVTGVELANGERVGANQFLLAAGPWSERLLGPLNCRLGIHPVRGQILLLNTPHDVGPTRIAGKRYLVPRDDGRVLVGSTEEPEAGFVKQTTPPGLAGLRAFATELVPELADAAIESGWAGLRPGSPDGLPFIGCVQGHENVFVAAGHARAGVQLSPGTARFVADLMFDRPTAIPREAFALDRQPIVPARPAFRS